MKKRITHVVLSAMMLFVFMLFLGVSQSQAASADTKGTLATVGKVTISSLKLDKNNYLVIKWKEVDGVSGYRVYRKTETDTKWVKVTTTTKTSCTDKKVKATAGSAVQYRVRAYLTGSDGKETLGSYSSTKKLTMPKLQEKIAYPISVDAKHFPDLNFREYVTEQFGDTLTEKEALSVTELDISFQEISSLSGIKYFPALTELWCDDNELTELDMSCNPALTKLFCYSNHLTSLDVTGNPALEVLNCDNNELAKLNVTGNHALTSLCCQINPLIEIDVTGNPELTKLYCYRTDLTELDVSQNLRLTDLQCYDCYLSKIDVKKNIHLTDLNCSENPLNGIDVTGNSALTVLICNNTCLTGLDVSHNPDLTLLSCGYNMLTKLDVSKNSKLNVLRCFGNQLTKLDISKNPLLGELECFGNLLTKLDVRKNHNLLDLLCDDGVNVIRK